MALRSHHRIPGLHGTGELFAPILERLTASLSPTIVEYPTTGAHTLDELADVVVNAAGDLDRPIALAESFSGPVLLQVLAREPALFRGVIFCASFATCPRPVLLRLASVMPLRWLFRLPLPGALIRALCVEAKSPPELIDEVHTVLARVRPEVLADRIQILAHLPDPPSGPVPVPALYLQGSQDRLVPALCATWFTKQFETAQVVKIDGPHFLLQTRPEEAAGVIERFCQEVATE